MLAFIFGNISDIYKSLISQSPLHLRRNKPLQVPAFQLQLMEIPAHVKASRVSVGVVFFMHGLCFASWASRIPTIQQILNLTAAQLGGILFVLPLGFFISLPFAGWFIAKAGSKKVAIFSSVLYGLAFLCIGWSTNIIALVLSLFAFGFCGNLLNISVNTQAVSVEAFFKKRLMSFFHGLWSLAGFAGAAIGTWMIRGAVSPFHHFMSICFCFLLVSAISVFYLIKEDVSAVEKRPIFSMPDKSLLNLGIIAFCSMMAEGAMFDWSGIYFLEVVKVDRELTGVGYVTFMIAMAGTRFTADRLSNNFGIKRMLKSSGVVTTLGLLLAVLFPAILPASLGFFLVGMGVSSVVPLVFSEAGKSKTLSAGTALCAVSSLGFLGLLIGPPFIGLVAEVTSLKVSFLALSLMTITIFILASLMHKRSGKTQQLLETKF